MPAFEIRFGEFRRDASLRAGFYYFDVGWPGSEARFGLEFPDSLGRQWGLEGQANADQVRRRAVLGCLKRHLAAVDTSTRDFARLVLVTAAELPKYGREWAAYQVPECCPYERKECKHKSGKQGDYRCSAAEEGDGWGGRTTLADCEACGLPSTDIVCSYLAHPSTGSSRSFGRPWSRKLWDVFCEVGYSVDARCAPECIPGGRDCWFQTYEPAQVVPTVVPTAVRSVLAEAVPAVLQTELQFSIAEVIDQLNTAFRKRYQRPLIEIDQARSIEDLVGECPTDDALQHKLQVLAGLLGGMQLSGLLTAEQEEGCQGSVDLLARLIGRDFPTLPEQHVRTLRNINKLAAGYPRHAKIKNIERAHTELGLPYPLSDYPEAWAIVRETFIQTLRQFALQLS